MESTAAISWMSRLQSRVGPTERRSGESGAALAEAAISFSVIMLLFFLVLEGGWMYFTYLGLQSAAAEGAAYGMLYPTRETSTSEAGSADPNNIAYRALTASSSPLVEWEGSEIGIDVTFPTPGNLIAVTVTYQYHPFSPLGRLFFGNDDAIPLRATAVQTILASSGS